MDGIILYLRLHLLQEHRRAVTNVAIVILHPADTDENDSIQLCNMQYACFGERFKQCNQCDYVSLQWLETAFENTHIGK